MAKKRPHSDTHPGARRASKKPKAATELEQFTEGVIVFVNESLKRADVQHDVIANFLFSSVCEGSADMGLDPTGSDSPKLRALHHEAGRALRLDKTSLSRHLRIGALNSVVKDKRWHKLAWSHKVALLPLVKNAERGLPAIAAALDANDGPAMTTLGLKAWVADEMKTEPRVLARKTVTVASAKRFFSTGALLADPQVLMSLVKRIDKLDDDAQKEAMEALEATAVAVPQMLALLAAKKR